MHGVLSEFIYSLSFNILSFCVCKAIQQKSLFYIKVNNNLKIQEIYFSHLDHSQSMIKTSVEKSYIKKLKMVKISIINMGIKY